jgi:hypothetical protein
LLSGEVILSPETVNLRWKWAVSSLAGVLASGGVAIAGIVPIIGQATFALTDIFRLETGLLSSLLFASNVVPSNAFRPNDVFQLWLALRGGETWTRWENCLRLLYINWLGVVPREWPTSIVDGLRAPDDASTTQLRGIVLSIYAYGDRHDTRRVDELTVAARRLAEAHNIRSLLADVAFWQIAAGCDTVSIKRTIEKIAAHSIPANRLLIKVRALSHAKTETLEVALRRRACAIVEREIAEGRGGIGIAEQRQLSTV